MAKQISYLTILLAAMLCFFQCQNQEKKPQMMGAAMSPNFTATHFPSICPLFPIPEGVTDTFSLSQNYPDTFDVNAPMPWAKIDFKQDYKGYMKAVLDYCMDGNLEVDFKVQDNKKRKWYSTPWMHNDSKIPGKAQNSGREYMHGLTREITIPTGTLSSKQTNDYQTYAIAFYNEPGGYTIGKVWKDPNNPDINKSNFPEGTVTYKLLFTEAPLEEAPYLENAKSWTANIFSPAKESKVRQNMTVRLLQLDIAIKDKRAETGWVMGTFVYDASTAGNSWVDRMLPVGLMWGDDQNDTTMLNITNRYNPSLKQSIINQDLLKKDDKKANKVYLTHLGMGGRMNGPVDNPMSSCISCHAHAALDEVGNEAKIMANFKGIKYSYDDFKAYFSEVPCGVQKITQDGIAYTTADYSFQIQKGIRCFKAAEAKKKKAGGGLRSAPLVELRSYSRDGHDN